MNNLRASLAFVRIMKVLFPDGPNLNDAVGSTVVEEEPLPTSNKHNSTSNRNTSFVDKHMLDALSDSDDDQPTKDTSYNDAKRQVRTVKS